MRIQLLTLDEVESYLVHCVALSGESGRDGDVYFGPYSRDEPFPVDVFRERTQDRWSKPFETPGWRRAWGVFDGEHIVGSGDVAGGDLPTGLHRVDLGLGILRSHRRRGLGRRLLEEIILWCRSQSSIHWIDLGVFGDNLPAQALFKEAGFERVGVTLDRWVVDGLHIEEISMTLNVQSK